MQRPGETGIQSFSLPLITLPNPAAETKKSEPGGVLDIIIKYRQSKLTIPQTDRVRENSADVSSQVCLVIEVVRACGLKVYLLMIDTDCVLIDIDFQTPRGVKNTRQSRVFFNEL